MQPVLILTSQIHHWLDFFLIVFVSHCRPHNITVGVPQQQINDMTRNIPTATRYQNSFLFSLHVIMHYNIQILIFQPGIWFESKQINPIRVIRDYEHSFDEKSYISIISAGPNSVKCPICKDQCLLVIPFRNDNSRRKVQSLQYKSIGMNIPVEMMQVLEFTLIDEEKNHSKDTKIMASLAQIRELCLEEAPFDKGYPHSQLFDCDSYCRVHSTHQSNIAQQIDNCHCQIALAPDRDITEEKVKERFSLEDPERPEYDCRSLDQSQPCGVEDYINALQEPEPSKWCLPTKSGSTDTEILGQLIPYDCQTRHDKLMRFLEKRKRRNWNRKVYYDCRKKVADSRLRIKGRFITRVQAEQILKRSLNQISLEDVKIMLEKHFESKGHIKE